MRQHTAVVKHGAHHSYNQSITDAGYAHYTRAYTKPNPDAHTNTNPDPHAYSYPNTNADTDPYPNAHAAEWASGAGG